jgi:hypothetical protein
MEFLSDIELKTRTKEIISNLTLLSAQGQISIHPPRTSEPFWLIKWTHALEEFSLRYGPYPNGFSDGSMKDAPIVRPTYPELPPSKVAIDSVGGLRKGCIYKFGKSEHLKPMFNDGVIRIAPASYYADPSLNKAIQDDELGFIIRCRSDSIILQSGTCSTFPTFGDVKFHLKSGTNYYVHCFAAAYTYREYDDFEADACIVISNPRKLFQKMMKAVRKQKSSFKGFASPVKYLDPLTCRPDSINIFFSKHFKYSNQNEVRTIWLPETPTVKLEPFFIEVGNMIDYADLISVQQPI